METTKRFQPWADNSSFQMIDVGPKEATHRIALAEGTLQLSGPSFLALQEGKNPKGNVLAAAEVAAILCAKRTAEWIPLCHPLPLDRVKVWFELKPTLQQVTVYCEVSTHSKTGVEMEALSGVNGALLTLYDLSKAVDPVLKITEIRLNKKQGGKHGTWVHPEWAEPQTEAATPSRASLKKIRVAVVTISDRVSRRESEDRSGPLLQSLLREEGADLLPLSQIPDEKEGIAQTLRTLALEAKAKLIVTTGGTGLGPRDVTPEAVAQVCERLIPGFGERLRQSGAQYNELAYLSRSVAGLLGDTLIVTLPGSPKGVREGVESIRRLLPHALHILSGGHHG